MPKAGTLRITITPDAEGIRTEILPPPAVPVAALVKGKSAEDVATIIPLIFNVCAAAQEAAVRSALDLPVPENLNDRVQLETIREHAIKLLVVWPALLGIEPDRRALVHTGAALNDRDALAALRGALFAPMSGAPENWDDLLDWMQTGSTAPARTFALLHERLDPDWGRTDVPLWSDALPVDWQTATQPCGVVDNGPAGRVADRALMNEVEETCGRGILWRMTARLIEMDELLNDNPAPIGAARGVAPAARGAMMVRADLDDTGVRSFERLSPTDFALAAGGVMEQALRSLPAKPALSLKTLAQLVIETVDPCIATELEIAHA